MKIEFVRGILQIEDARIIYRNFAVIIPNDEIKDILVKEGWNVKIKPPREEDESPFMYMPVKIKFNNRGPSAYIESGNSFQKLTEETIGILDDIDIASVDMDLRPYDWEVNGKTGRSAYLQAINVVQNIDRFGARHAEQSNPKLVNKEENSDDKLPF